VSAPVCVPGYSSLSSASNDLCTGFRLASLTCPGNTVQLQYSSGTHRIASWSDITNAHPLPGPGIIAGLGAVGRPLGRALLLLAEMSSKGNLATGEYTRHALDMARADRAWVVGFIAMRRIEHLSPAGSSSSHAATQPGSSVQSALGQDIGIDITASIPPASQIAATDVEDFLILTPGVGMSASGDSLGQQYRHPREVILESGCDVIIVGRGIYKEKGREAEVAESYRKEGWAAYQTRIGAAYTTDSSRH
jgi:orotidine-5'-phosphate decarboxylase